MHEMSIINEEARGFAGLIAKVMAPLNQKEEFKQKFKNTERTFILNPLNLDHAAIIIIDKGTIKVKSVSNKPKENLKKKVLGWDGYLGMDSQVFLSVAMKRLSIIGVGLKVLTGKVKLKGITKLLALLKVFDLLN